ncbi:MAG: tRNA pseudouridine(38-40) synthase TruA [Clostridia bacterium]
MQRVKVTISYDGGDYHGWQRQPNGVCVQEIVEKTLAEICGTAIKIYASGRTDEGVHAIGQVFHFDNPTTIPADRICFVLNRILPNDIVATASELVSDDFNARYSAKRKTYLYKMYFSTMDLPFERKYKLRIDTKIDIEKMRQAANYLVGIHDFVGFSATGSYVGSTIREIFDASFTEVGNELQFRVTGSGFLYNMVRIIVGTLLEVGYGKYQPERVRDVLLSKNRKLAGKTVSGVGLYLEKVEY